jgi:hypothetical protein
VSIDHLIAQDWLPVPHHIKIDVDGVQPIAETRIERDLLLYNIYVNKIVRMIPPRKGFRWPWSRK